MRNARFCSPFNGKGDKTPSSKRGFERGDCGGFVEGGAVHFGGDGVAGEKVGAYGWYELRAGCSGRQPFLLAAERQDDGHAIVNVADCFVCLCRKDGEVDGVLFGRVETRRLSCVDACHRKEAAGFQRDAVGLFVTAFGALLVVAVGEHETVAAAE